MEDILDRIDRLDRDNITCRNDTIARIDMVYYSFKPNSLKEKKGK